MAFTGASLSESLEKFAAGCFHSSRLQSSNSTSFALIRHSLSYLVTVKRLLAALSAHSLHVIHVHFSVYFGLFAVRESERNTGDEHYSCLHIPALMIIFSS